MRALSLLAVTFGCGLCLAGLSACSSTDLTKTVSFEESSPVRTLVIEGQTGDVLTLSYTCSDSDSDSDSNCGVDYTVQVPAGTAVDISSGTGDVTLSQLTAAVDVQAGTGDVTADGLASSLVKLTVGTGDVKAGFVKSPSALTANVSTGDVSIAVPAGEYAVDAQANTGDVNVKVPQNVGSGNAITVKVGTGDVTVS